jgi:hypothetical protein
MAASSAARPGRGQRTNPDCVAHNHGDYAAYRRRCRCPEAREDDRLYSKRLREGRAQPRRIPRHGTIRRLQALAAIGWRWTDMAAHLDTGTWQSVQNLAIRERGTAVTVTTAARVDNLYRRLAGTPGPSETTRRRAAAKGWAPPLAWDDDIDDPAATPWTDPGVDVVDWVAIRRVLDGQPTPLTRLERHHAVHAAVPRFGVHGTAARMGMSFSTVRDLYRRPLPADQPALTCAA